MVEVDILKGLKITYHHNSKMIAVSATRGIEVTGTDQEVMDYIKDRINNKYDLIIDHVGLVKTFRGIHQLRLYMQGSFAL